jgi:hypothetical protein
MSKTLPSRLLGHDGKKYPKKSGISAGFGAFSGLHTVDGKKSV